MFHSWPLHVVVINWLKGIRVKENSVEKLQEKGWFF